MEKQLYWMIVCNLEVPMVITALGNLIQQNHQLYITLPSVAWIIIWITKTLMWRINHELAQKKRKLKEGQVPHILFSVYLLEEGGQWWKCWFFSALFSSTPAFSPSLGELSRLVVVKLLLRTHTPPIKIAWAWLLTQLLAHAHPRQQEMTHRLESLTPQVSPRGSAGILFSTWTSPGCYGHLRSDKVSKCYFSVNLFLSLYLSNSFFSSHNTKGNKLESSCVWKKV